MAYPLLSPVTRGSETEGDKVEQRTWHEVFQSARPKQYTLKERILSQEGRVDCVMVLESGLASVSRRDENGREHWLAFRTRGALLGETAVVTEGPRSADVVAFTECWVRALDRNTFLARVNEKGMHKELLHSEAAKRQELEDELVKFRTLPLINRLAGRLVTIVDSTHSMQIKGWNHDAMAHLIGVERPAFTHALNNLRKPGILRTRNRLIAVCDLPALRAMART